MADVRLGLALCPISFFFSPLDGIHSRNRAIATGTSSVPAHHTRTRRNNLRFNTVFVIARTHVHPHDA